MRSHPCNILLALAIVAVLNYSPGPVFVEGGNYIDCPDKNKSILTDTCYDYEQNMDGQSSPYSCTPWPFRSYPENCGNPDDRIVAGDGTNDVGAFRSDNADNFFVFHTCDGAGAITDCQGNQNFVEQFGPWCGQSGDDGNDCSIQCDVHAPGGDGSIGQHQQCAKHHDGTDKWYEWYKCGNWYAKDLFNYGSAGGFNEYQDWFTKGLFTDSSYIDTYDPDGTVVLYDWVCHEDTTSNKNLEPFTGDAKVNCYCDNEPNMYDGAGYYEPPPGAAIYSFWVKWDANRNGGEYYLEMHDITSGWEVGEIFNIYPFYNAW